MTLADYYNSYFRGDLQAVVAGLPELHAHGFGDVTLQPRSISRANPIVRRWSKDSQGLFASALFISFLADQVCYSHFSQHYPAFRHLTQHPKWRGDCPGGCSSHIHPLLVFPLIGQPAGAIASRVEPEYGALPDDLFLALERELLDFFPAHLPAIDAAAFRERCESEVSTHFRLLYLASRRHEQPG